MNEQNEKFVQKKNQKPPKPLKILELKNTITELKNCAPKEDSTIQMKESVTCYIGH